MENLENFYINGRWVTPNSTETMPVSNPATEQKLMKPSLRTDHHDDLSSQLSTINTAIVERQKELNSEEEEKVVTQIKSNT